MKKMFYLDVDGVINAFSQLPEGEVFTYLCMNHTIKVPEYMAPLIQGLAAIGEITWLTTWREHANEWISPLVGLPNDLPYITDGTNRRMVDWKADAAMQQAQIDTQNGYDIYWIEDFGNGIWHDVFKTVTPVNTAANAEFVLLPQHLPRVILQDLVDVYDGPMNVPMRNIYTERLR